MKLKLLVIFAVCALGNGCRADEIKLEAPIESVSLFKNGLAVIRRTAEISGPGTYRLDDVPAPVHGTFWVDGDVPVEVQATMREEEASPNAAVDFQSDLVGKDVILRFKEASTPPISGRVVALARPKGEEAWNRDYSAQQYGNYMGPGGSGQFLQIESQNSRMYVDLSTIAAVQLPPGDAKVRLRRQVFLLNSKSSKKGTIHLSYLSKGMAWAPSYKMELVDEKNLTLEQQAVVKNELGDLKDVDVSLITGFPNFQFAHVLSPLSLNQNWAQFFAQMRVDANQLTDPGANGAMGQGQSVQSNAAVSPGAGLDLSATPFGEGTDLHYQPIGKETLAEGDSLMISVAKGNSTYERVMEWVIPDTRNDQGQMNNGQSGEPQLADDVWESVKFKNPLSFPMTTGPVMVLDGGHIAGQRVGYWANPGEETSIKINKALSIRTQATEEEKFDANQPTVTINDWNYRKVTVKGSLTASNHRNQDVRLVVRRQFSGDLYKADGNPTTKLLEVGVYNVNHRNELTWSVPMKAGEAITLTYQYTVLVRP